MAIINTEINPFAAEDLFGDSSMDPHEKSKYVDLEDNMNKKFSVDRDDAKAQILITSNEVVITNQRNGIAVGEWGTVIGGPTHFTNNISDISFNSYWRLNDELMTCLPSSIYTPIPVLKYKEPAYAEKLARLASFLAG